MKKLFVPVLICVLLLAGCKQKQDLPEEPVDMPPTDPKADISSDAPTTNSWNTFDVLYKQGDNFVIYTNQIQSEYRYRIKDSDGEVIDTGYHNGLGGFDIYYSEENPQLLVVRNGAGGPAWLERYCNVSNGKVSRFFSCPIAQSGERVAYFAIKEDNRIVLIVQDIFNPDSFYREIQRDFSDFVIKSRADAEFLSGNTRLKVTYWKNPGDELITEIIDLGQDRKTGDGSLS